MNSSYNFDNGKAFAFYEQIRGAPGVAMYFTHPCHSWKRGLNENHHGLIRQYLPKEQALDKVTHKQVLEIQTRLNKRPCKLLDFRTLKEVYAEVALAA